jgi:ADP-dependent phosphofructokinase/glucokinase
MRIYGERVKITYPESFGDLDKGPVKIKVQKRKIPVRVDKQPIPIKDFINFKVMTGNEIILNLDNVENLMNGELISGLYELSKRDKDGKFDWNTHPVTAKCVKDLKRRMGALNAMNIV